jgi:XisH protein
MSAKDLYHDSVREALVKEGWTITHDPYVLDFGKDKGYVDLGAEFPIAAEKGTVQIAVEIKSFLSESDLTDLQ